MLWVTLMVSGSNVCLGRVNYIHDQDEHTLSTYMDRLQVQGNLCIPIHKVKEDKVIRNLFPLFI